MELRTPIKCIQYLLFFLNVMFAAVGCLLIVVGVAVLKNYNKYSMFIETSHFKPAEILIACGAILLIISFIGCIGTIQLSTMVVNIFALLLLLLLLVEIGGVITAFAMHCDIYGEVEENMQISIQNYKGNNFVREAWDFTQEYLKCCGVHEPINWAPEKIDGPKVYLNETFFTVPFSCCEDQDDCSHIYAKGCLDIVSNYVSKSTLLFIYIGIGIGANQLLSVIFAYILGKGIRRAKTEIEMERQENLHRTYEQGREPAPSFPVSGSTDA